MTSKNILKHLLIQCVHVYLRKLKQTISTAWLNQHYHLCKCPSVNTAVVLQLKMVPISQHWSGELRHMPTSQAYTNRWICVPELFPKYSNHGMVFEIFRIHFLKAEGSITYPL